MFGYVWALSTSLDPYTLRIPRTQPNLRVDAPLTLLLTTPSYLHCYNRPFHHNKCCWAKDSSRIQNCKQDLPCLAGQGGYIRWHCYINWLTFRIKHNLSLGFIATIFLCTQRVSTGTFWRFVIDFFFLFSSPNIGIQKNLSFLGK